MPDPASTNRTLEEFRAYLEVLARVQVSPRLRSKFGASDIVAKTVWEAYQALDRLRDLDEPGQKRWLRRMLANNLLDEIAHWKRGRRDYRAEQPLQAEADASSVRLQQLVAEDTSPSEQAAEREASGRLLEAVAGLPEREREALILQRWHGYKLAEIAEHLGCTAGAVAGLLDRGLKRLKTALPEME
jgi:RNA polymerase sigma-70 factor (ECF subfamily)